MAALLLMKVVVQQHGRVCAAAAAIPLLAPVCGAALPANTGLPVEAAGLARRHGGCSLCCHDCCGHIDGGTPQQPSTAAAARYGGGRQGC
jgi:hypothetical protein